MSGRAQALMRTRCPSCGTVFRVTSEQLRLKAGMVRCGHCQGVFNAFDQFQSAAPSVWEDVPEDQPVSVQDALPSDEITEASPLPEPTPALTEAPSLANVSSENAWPVIDAEFSQDEFAPVSEPEPVSKPEPEPARVQFEPLPEPESGLQGEPMAVSDEDISEGVETPEETTQAAREAGLVAARELSETQAYDRWAAGTLASDGQYAFGNEPTRRLVWPFVLVAFLLLLGLLAQSAFHYRSELVQRLPEAAKLFELAAINVPLPRNVELVAIETSDLQSDNARGMFILNATLRNRARYTQDWPALELTLTDTNDAAVARRVMFAADYLPPGTPATSFPANGETALRLWIEAKDTGAAGYRLYIFYP